MKRSVQLAIVSSVVLGLAACGGGGGSSPTTGGGGSTTTTSGNLATSVPTPTYAAGSVEMNMFTQLNQIRSAGGFGMLAQNTALDASAKAHANYMFANYYTGGLWSSAMYSVDPATGWLLAHVERVGNPGFTGVLPVDRAIAQGYKTSYVAEVSAPLYTSSMERPYPGCIDELLTTVFHRGPLLDTQLRDFGASVSTSTDGGAVTCIVEPAFTTANQGFVPTGWVALYPYDRETGLATTMLYGEAPDPVPSAPIKGNPVSIYVEPQNTLTVTSFTLSDKTGAQVPVVLLQKANFPQYLSAAEAYIVPTQALSSGMTYTVQFIGTNNGSPLSRTWSFTTR